MAQAMCVDSLLRARILSVVVFFVCAAILSAGTPGESAKTDSAQQILQATEVKGGLIVHVGCGDGKLTAALHVADSYLVHGLDTDPEKVQQARQHIRSLGLYGAVSVNRFSGARLPYVDNLVNLVVSESLGEVRMDEVMRVLCPGGVAYLKQGGEWTRTVKSRPEDIDDWTHYLHDAAGNAVAADLQVGPPRHVRWVAAPLWSRSHEFTPSINALVSGGGWMFYILDEGMAGLTDLRFPARWALYARDAFSGVLLWKLPVPNLGLPRVEHAGHVERAADAEPARGDRRTTCVRHFRL